MSTILDAVNYPKDLKHLSSADLAMLSSEIRTFIINTISKTGGHLGASLGVIELTVALHYCFDAPQDSIIWDIGHQTYPHKILTGRKNQMHTIRKAGGISGFANIFESEYDAFGAGHSSTSISAGLGILAAKTIKNDDSWVVSVIGDGAMSAGLAYEAMNNVSEISGKFIVILNDNDMSISRPTGAISKYLPRLTASKSYQGIKEIGRKMISKISDNLADFCSKTEKSIKHFVTDTNIFEEFGFEYIGPIDGHSIADLTSILNDIKRNINGRKPVLLHIITNKGHGYKPAEQADDKFHGVSTFDVQTGEQSKKSSSVSYSQIVCNKLCQIAETDSKITVITPAMKAGSCLENFANQFSNRFFDVGIAEQHAITFAAGLAKEGLKPYAVIYSTFLQRAYDQIIHDVAIQNLPVRFAIDRSGLVGEDGPTHHGVFDMSFLRCIPNMVICSPSDQVELEQAIEFSADYEASPFAFRYPRGSSQKIDLMSEFGESMFEFGKGRFVKTGSSKKAIISVGTILHHVLKAYLHDDVTIFDARFLKPLDSQNILQIIKHHEEIIIIEEGSIGGLYSAILELVNESNVNLSNTKIIPIILSDQFIEHGGQQYLLDKYLNIA